MSDTLLDWSEVFSGTGRVEYHLAHSALADAFVLQLLHELFELVRRDIERLKTVGNRLLDPGNEVSLEIQIEVEKDFSRQIQENAKTLEILQATCRRIAGGSISSIEA